MPHNCRQLTARLPNGSSTILGWHTLILLTKQRLSPLHRVSSHYAPPKAPYWCPLEPETSYLWITLFMLTTMRARILFDDAMRHHRPGAKPLVCKNREEPKVLLDATGLYGIFYFKESKHTPLLVYFKESKHSLASLF